MLYLSETFCLEYMHTFMHICQVMHKLLIGKVGGNSKYFEVVQVYRKHVISLLKWTIQQEIVFK